MSDAWNELQALKSKKLSLREKIAARKELIAKTKNITATTSQVPNETFSNEHSTPQPVKEEIVSSPVKPSDNTITTNIIREEKPEKSENVKEIEKIIFHFLRNKDLTFPVQIHTICSYITKEIPNVSINTIKELLNKYSIKGLLNLDPNHPPDQTIVTSVNHTNINLTHPLPEHEAESENKKEEGRKRVINEEGAETKASRAPKKTKTTSLEDLLSMQSAMDREGNKCLDEIYLLLNTPTAMEAKRNENFMSKGGRRVREYCCHGTRPDCSRFNVVCDKLHFRKIIHQHTDENLGDCSFLNTCFHMETCKYVHYQIDYSSSNQTTISNIPTTTIQHKKNDPKKQEKIKNQFESILYPPQWIQCDLRNFNMTVLGKFSVVMADPPWDIHMELPYGTMSDEEMRKLNVPVLQDDGYIFLWVTGRAMELGRECLILWGYERVDEVIWVKTNQLQRIIRTGRTGHWLNHGKEHCLVGVKGNPKVNKGIDCDVITSEVRATSHKPDEIYGIIERLSPGTRKLELFGRPHNTEDNWITLGNQLDGVKLLDPAVVKAFKQGYPSGSAV